MKNIYRGDTFEFDFSADIEESEEQYIFEKGEKLRVGLKCNALESSEYLLYREKEITESTSEVHFEFPPDETKAITPGNKIIEVELTTKDGKVMTIYQESIWVKGDVLND